MGSMSSQSVDSTQPPSPPDARKARSGVLVTALLFSAMASLATGMIAKGMYFVFEDRFGDEFTYTVSLLLGLALNVPYLPGALLAGPLARRIGPRNTLVLAGVIQGASAAALIWPGAPPLTFWLVSGLYNIANGMQWPLIEAYVSSGTYGSGMRRATGYFNITWSLTIAPSLVLVGFFLGSERTGGLFLFISLMHLLTIAVLQRLPGQPAPHDISVAHEHTGDEYPALLLAARILLPISYMLDCSFGPLMPGRWEELGVVNESGAKLTATWLFVRILAFLAMFLSNRWHGKWSILAAGWIFISCGYALILGGSSVALVASGLACYGLGQGILYNAALYYAMAVGHAEVDSGGVHEAVIGAGFIAGPSVSLIGMLTARRLAPDMDPILAVASAVGLCLFLGGVSAMTVYVRARKRRRETARRR